MDEVFQRTSTPEWHIIIRLVVAVILGGALGMKES
jgi:uncharacterized membrane protein YhiD involved in acid resistance